MHDRLKCSGDYTQDYTRIIREIYEAGCHARDSECLVFNSNFNWNFIYSVDSNLSMTDRTINEGYEVTFSFDDYQLSFIVLSYLQSILQTWCARHKPAGSTDY